MRKFMAIAAIAASSLCAAASSAEPLSSGAVTAQFQDRAGAGYRLVSVRCVLDGIQVCNRSENLDKSFPLFSKRVRPGTHRLNITAVYEGAGGPFSYVEGFRYTVQTARDIDVGAADTDRVNVMVREAGGPTVPMEQRLRIGVSVK